MSSQRKRSSRPWLEVLENRITPALSVTAGFNGIGNTGWTPPDPSLAAGPNHVVETVNESLAIFNKATGAMVSRETLQTLFSGFANGTTNDSGMYDPSVLFDDIAGRFIVEAQVRDSANYKAYVDIAVSNSSDPTQGFTEIHQIEVDEEGQYWSDNGKLGFNADAYVFTGNAYTFSGISNSELVLTINKSSVLDQNVNTLTDYLVNYNDNGTYPYGFSLIPARMHASVSGSPMWFVETYPGGSSSSGWMGATRMDNVLSSNPTFTNYTLSANPYIYANASNLYQPGGTVDPGDSRVLNVEWNNNNLVAAFNSSVGTDAAAAWIQLNTGGASPTVVQQGVIHPGAGISTYLPAVAVDANGDLGLTYMESSASEYISMYVTGRLASDPAGTMEAPVRAVAGTNTTLSNRVGDYSGISLDPSSANTFWTTTEYGLNAWATWLTAFQLTSSSDQPPTVATPASASPSPVTGTTANLSVLGADDTGESSLTYTWSLVSGPAGAPAPTFSANGTNAAKNSTATFYQAGSYTFQVTITDPAGLTATSSATVAVNQTVASLTVTPASAALLDAGTQQFTATALDQFGKALASQPSFSWVLTGIGSLTGTGMYTAPGSGTGSATVAAGSGTLSATASVTVAASPPAVVAPASATPNPVTGTTTTLSVQGSDASGASSLIYTWSLVTAPAGAPPPTFSANGTSAAQNTTATFSQAGSYTFQVTITDPAGLTAISSVAVTVNQTLTSVTLTPGTATVPDGGTQQFTATALDQFGNSLAAQPSFSWSVPSGIGAVNSGGTYTAPSSGTGSAAVGATSGAVSGTASVTVTAPSAPATPANLTATAVLKNQVNLSWAESSANVSGFNIQRSSNGGKSWTLIAHVAGTVTAYADTTVSKAKTYQYKVDAFNSVGPSAWSTAVTVTTPLQTPSLLPEADVPTFALPPAAPSNLTARAVSPRQVNLSWVANSTDATGFVVQRLGADGIWATVVEVGAGVTAFSDTTVNPAQTYRYRVFATNDAGNSPFSNVTQPVGPLSRLTGVTRAFPFNPALGDTLPTQAFDQGPPTGRISISFGAFGNQETRRPRLAVRAAGPV
jgi:hypothetical protein